MIQCPKDIQIVPVRGIVMNQLIHTTAGVRDIFGDEYQRKSILMNRISSLFSSYGYKNIQTPSI